MILQLKPGDRVRVTPKSTMPGHQPGEKGTVLAGPIIRAGTEPYYIVAMDRGDTTTSTIFGAEEIERDQEGD